jgi:U4/U6.U5 tri-snRNP component SNU23
MSTNLNYKQVANVDRRKWDVEAYEKRAQARRKAMEEGRTMGEDGTTAAASSAGVGSTVNNEKQEFRPAVQGAAGPEGSDRAYLKARATAVLPELEAQVGQSTFVDTPAASSSGGTTTGGPNKTDGVTATGVGWYCKVCDCYLKDSMTYLDHINGRKHQRKLGYSMRVQRSTTDDLKARLQALQRKKEATSKEDEQQEQVIDFATRVQEKDQALLERQEERRRRRKERKQKAKEGRTGGGITETTIPATEKDEKDQETNSSVQSQPTGQEVVDAEEEEEETEVPQVDPALAAMMGFSSFS